MTATLKVCLDRARVFLAGIYGRQPLVRRAKRWLFARLATYLPGLGRTCIVRVSIKLGQERLRLWVDAHSSVGLEAVMFGVYEPESMSRLLGLAARVSAERPTFVDVGANMGFYSIALALSQPGARVIACEPGPAAASLCERNIVGVAERLRSIRSRIELVKAAVTDRTGEVSFTVSQDLGHSSMLEVENFQAGLLQVPGMRLDDLCAEREISRIDVCKIDVEGAELDVVRGMSALLARGAVSLLQVEVNRPLWARSGRGTMDLVELLRGFGYSLFADQLPLLQRDDWAIEDLIFVGPGVSGVGLESSAASDHAELA